MAYDHQQASEERIAKGLSAGPLVEFKSSRVLVEIFCITLVIGGIP